MLTIKLNTTNPIWKAIDGYSQYEVSSDGQCRKKIKSGYRPIKPYWNNDHYQVSLTDEFRNRKCAYIHRLVLVSFGPDQPENKPLALHRDDNPSNNHIDNLVWGDKSDNGKMAVENGRLRPYSEHKFLNREEAAKVRSMRSLGLSMSRIAREFGCSRWTVSNVLNNRIKRLAA